LARDSFWGEGVRGQPVTAEVDLDHPGGDAQSNEFPYMHVGDGVVILLPHDVPIAPDSALIDPLADLVRHLRQRPQERSFLSIEHAPPGALPFLEWCTVELGDLLIDRGPKL